MDNVINNNGILITFVGIFMVFVGLILITIVISMLNRLFDKFFTKEIISQELKISEEKEISKEESIPKEHLIAIATTVELFSRLHLSYNDSKITFIHGTESLNGWKMGNKYDLRD